MSFRRRVGVVRSLPGEDVCFVSVGGRGVRIDGLGT